MKIPILVGPTASGKTSPVASIAQRVRPIEVISADSRQVYTKLDIGTAKPTPDERTRIPHHLVGIIDPAESYSAGRFRTDAEAAIADCLRRGVLPLVVGGTGLYLRALCDGLSRIPPVPKDVVDRLRGELADLDASALHDRLRAVDPIAASGIRPSDPQRIVRALAVRESTGRNLSDWWEEPPERSPYECAWIGIRWPRETLRERIRQRVGMMLEAGLEAEVRGLVAEGYAWESNALRTIGYREWRPYFAGRVALDDVRERIAIHTSQYAKRQMTWFNAVPHIRWLDGASNSLPRDVERWLATVPAG